MSASPLSWLIRLGLGLGTTLALLVLLSGQVRAHDPTLDWFTLSTPHFNVHYPEGTAELAQRVARAAEDALFQVSERLEHRPSSPIELVIVDDSDGANGSATILPYNLVHVFASPPANHNVLHDWDDYIHILLLHELAHIVHMDTVEGVPSWINTIFGRSVFPNGAQPTWFAEGLAIHFESACSSAGRMRSSLFRMYLRIAALSDTIPTLDQLTGTSLRWPQGNAPYLFGGFFINYLTERFGQEILADLSHHMAAMIIPWSLNILARRVMSDDYPDLYQEWRTEVRSQARAMLARLEQIGLSPFRQLTQRGQHQQRPRISPGGSQVLYYSGPVDDWSGLRLINTTGHDDRPLIDVNSDGGATFDPLGATVVFSQAEVWKEYHVYHDLWSLDLSSGQAERLTHGQRVKSPDFSPDGKAIVCVQNRAGRTRLVLIDRQTLEQRALTPFGPEQVYTPRFSPDGQRIVYSASARDSGRQLRLLDLSSGQTRVLTSAGTHDLDPVFEHDGRGVIFSSDLTGIFNIYRIDLDDGSLRRLTNLVSGAFSPEPTPDGQGLVFVVYGPSGYDIAWLDRPAGNFPLSPRRPTRPQAPYQESAELFPSKPYGPWWSLLPRSWAPAWGEDAWGTTIGILVGGHDALGKLGYQLALNYGPQSGQFHFDASLTARVLYPSFYLYAGRRVDRLVNGARINYQTWSVDREQLRFFGELSFPFSSLRRHHGLYFNYDLQLFDIYTDLPRDPMGLSPVLPDDRPLAWLGIGWYGSQIERYLMSISPESGMSASISLRYSHPAIGSSAHLAEARLWFRGYLPVIRHLHHVLAFGLQAGLAVGDERRRGLFAVGGLPISDPLLDAYFGYRYSGLFLRGYRPGSIVGSSYVLGSIEYRLPVYDVEWGILTLPFFLRRLQAGLFVDIGGASPQANLDNFVQDMLRVGLGVELRLNMLLAYHLPFTLRFGFGRGLMTGGTNNWYLVLGESF